MMEKFQLLGLGKQLPGELSGGQQQRVALARIMAYEPEVILLDEPFSALDDFLKDRLAQEMLDLLKDYRGTVVLVSHSRDEIYRFTRELLTMADGMQISYGGTREIFANPGRKETARLTGCKNIAEAKRIDGRHLEVPEWGITLCLNENIPEKVAFVGVRAHEFIPVWGDAGSNCIPVNVKSSAGWRKYMNNKEMIKYFYETVVTENLLDEVCRFVSPECVLKIGDDDIPLGDEGMKTHLIEVKKTYPDYSMKILRQFCEGDYVISEFIMEGTHMGEWLGMKPTNKRLRFTGVDIDKVCAPPYKEMSVSFTDEDEEAMLEKGYETDQSELGNVYYPKEGIEIPDHIIVKYVEYPWVTCFEVEGIEIIKEAMQKDIEE